jgi:hypothetical protein
MCYTAVEIFYVKINHDKDADTMNFHPGFKSKYFYLLGALLLFFLITPFLIYDKIGDTIVSILLSLIIVLCINLITFSRLLLWTSIVLGLISIVTYCILMFYHRTQLFNVIHHIAVLTFLLIMLAYIVISIAKHKTVTAETLLGAVCGYFLLGVTWTEVYLLILSVDPNAFSDHSTYISYRAYAHHFLYYSFETLTTLGYGDILPLSGIARTFSWLEAVTGQIYLAVWIAQLVGLRIAQAMNGKTPSA